MWKLRFLALLLLASLASASTNHIVKVGAGAVLKFDPENVVAVAGDTITYQFFARNHSVTQSSFQEPCRPLPGSGFFSSFVPNPATDGSAAPTDFTITVNDTTPLWLYCSQTNGDHCQKGMVGSVNSPNTGNTLDAFRELAKKAATPSTSPPGGLPVGGLRRIRVQVGAGTEFKFVPNNITEPVGTVVSFAFNPVNHSVVQSSFAEPCKPLTGQGGFSSGFIPTQVSPSGAIFDVVVRDTKPVWFYCAQTARTHCQAGMVGSINAPVAGSNTLEAFIALAKAAPTSTIGPVAPLGGTLTVNGTKVHSLGGGVVFDSTKVNTGGGNNNGNGEGTYTTMDPSHITQVPAPGQTDGATEGMAGGSPPGSYGWESTMSANATDLLLFLQFLDTALLEVLVGGFNRLSPGGGWYGAYPPSIVSHIGSMSAQALVHRATATDSLQHFGRPLFDASACRWIDSRTRRVDDFLQAALTLLLLEIGALAEATVRTARTGQDLWLVPALVTQVGAKSRMAAVVNMMQGHKAAATPREAMLTPGLAWSHVLNRFVADASCGADLGSGGGLLLPEKPFPAFTITDLRTSGDGRRATSVTVDHAAVAFKGTLWTAWLGAWGHLRYSIVNENGTSSVPEGLWGHAWVVLTSKGSGSLQELEGLTVAGPELVWVSQP